MTEDFIIIDCPSCKGSVIIHKKDINCSIFRHGVFKKNFEQINPHLSKNECDSLKQNDLIHGCGNPFKIINENQAVICDYI